MRSFLMIAIAAFIMSGCASNQPTVVQNTNNTATPRGERPQAVTAHTTEGRQPMANSSGSSGKWTASGDPIDTAKFDGTIAEAEKSLKSKPNDEQSKKTLAQAYFDRGFALTEARQYAAATGDFRRALKLDPTHEESKKWLDQIVGIYSMLKKEPPKEGEEPPPLPLKN